MIDVVYIDDEKALVRATTIIFEKLGLVTRGFTSPEEALEFIASNEVRLVLCDFRMPTMNGLKVLEAMPKDIPFYLISGDLGLELNPEQLSQIAGTFAKPISPTVLVDAIKKRLEIE